MSMISFARGVPAPECMPVEELAECARAALQRDGRTILSYGPSAGYGPLRARLAAQHGVDQSRIFLTNGSLQGFVFLAQRLAPGKRVHLEEGLQLQIGTEASYQTFSPVGLLRLIVFRHGLERARGSA